MAIGLQQLRETTRLLPRAFESPVLSVFALLCGVEALGVLTLPDSVGNAVAHMLGDTLLGVFATADVTRVMAVVVILMAADLVRTALFAPIRHVMLHDEHLSRREVFNMAFRRVGKLFLLQQLVGIFVMIVSAICVLLGLSIQTFPHLLVTFTLAPAFYMVIALERPIALSLSTAVRVTKRNFVAVFGVQAVLLALAYWISQFFQSVSADPMSVTWAALGLLATYRFATFFGMTTLYVALEEAGEFE